MSRCHRMVLSGCLDVIEGYSLGCLDVIVGYSGLSMSQQGTLLVV